MLKSIIALLTVASLLVGCAHQPLKAPCSPSDCHGRIKVNSWN